MRKLIHGVRANEGRYLNEKVIRAVRSDNEAVFSGSGWSELLVNEQVRGWHPVPYTPQQNGVIERFMRTLATNVRACLIGVDHALWCFAAEYVAWSWNRTPRKKYARAEEFNGLAPEDIRIARGFVAPYGEPGNPSYEETEKELLRGGGRTRA